MFLENMNEPQTRQAHLQVSELLCPALEASGKGICPSTIFLPPFLLLSLSLPPFFSSFLFLSSAFLSFISLCFPPSLLCAHQKPT